MKKAILILVFVGGVCSLKLYAQDDIKTLAFNAYNNKNWTDAEKYFQQTIKNSPTDTFSVYYYAMTQLKLKKYSAAQQNFRSLYALNLQSDFKNESGFELAKTYAATNDQDKCIQLLNEIAANSATFAQRLNDTIFSALRTVQGFKNAEQKFKENATPCLYDDKYKKLDFFVGIWDVYIGDNYADKVAVDTVSKFYGGCSIDEKFKWLGNSDYVGESISFFDNTSQRFRMCWAGKSGDIRNFEEMSSAQNSIVFFAVTTDGKSLIHRKLAITYNPADSTIHEHIENSYDLGKTWQPDFDALFKKANH